MMSQPPAPSTHPRDKWIPWYFVLAFLVVFAVNGIFIYAALGTHRGVVSDQAYRNGINYNQIVKKVRALKEVD
jgi:nitrogen fixation protein FixH